MFAGCGSPWKKPWRKIIVIHVSVTRYASARRSSTVSSSVSTSASWTPSSHSSVSTRARVYDQKTRGTRTCGSPAKLRWKRLRVARLEPVVELLAELAGELVDELARVDEVERVHPLAHEARGLVHAARGRPRSGAARRAAAPSRRRARPFGSVARCTCPIDAAATGVGSKSRKSRSSELPRSSSITRSACSNGNGRTSSWSAAQLGDDVRRDDVGPRREQLPELDERRAELVEQLAQVLAARRARRRRSRPRRSAPPPSGPAAGR